MRCGMDHVALTLLFGEEYVPGLKDGPEKLRGARADRGQSGLRGLFPCGGEIVLLLVVYVSRRMAH